MSLGSSFAFNGIRSTSKTLGRRHKPRVRHSAEPPYVYYSGPQHLLDKTPELKRLLTTPSGDAFYLTRPRTTETPWATDGTANPSDPFADVSWQSPRYTQKSPGNTRPMAKPGIHPAQLHEIKGMKALLRAEGLPCHPYTQFDIRYVDGSKYSRREERRTSKASWDAAWKFFRSGRYHGVTITRYPTAEQLDADLSRIVEPDFYRSKGPGRYSGQFDLGNIVIKDELIRLSPTEILQSASLRLKPKSKK